MIKKAVSIYVKGDFVYITNVARANAGFYVDVEPVLKIPRNDAH